MFSIGVQSTSFSSRSRKSLAGVCAMKPSSNPICALALVFILAIDPFASRDIQTFAEVSQCTSVVYLVTDVAFQCTSVAYLVTDAASQCTSVTYLVTDAA